MIEIAVFDTKSYDREYFAHAPGAERVAWRFHDFRLSAETAPAAKGAQAVCAFVSDQADRGCLEILAVLGVKLIALRCAGCNNVDLAAAKSLGLAVVHVPAYLQHAVAEHAVAEHTVAEHTVAEHTVALLLTLNRKIHRAFNRVRELNFSLSGLVGFDLHGKTVGIVGTGRIGRIAAQIFRGFGCDVLAHDPFPALDWAAMHGVRCVDLDALLAASDIVSLHVPLLPETHQLLGEQTLARMKPGVFIVNTSRCRLIDTGALIAALKAGHVDGVALDVYEEEEGIFIEDLSGQVLHHDELSLLLNFPNVLITAHQAFLTREALGEIARVTTVNVLQLETGRPFLAGTTL
jgi:D-lactate dehydrogenase